MPAAARFAALMPTRYQPFDATRQRHLWPLMVIATFGRFPPECADDLGGHLGAGCVAGGDDGGAEGLGGQCPIPA